MKYTLTYTGKEINTAIGNALNLQEALQDKQDTLTAGNGIKIDVDGTISCTNSSSSSEIGTVDKVLEDLGLLKFEA